ncbi:MAG: NAD(P)-dependent oxidoreductase [Rhizobiaceae bacterium]|nr:NAD(P)-dependent oxidoreductase [Rhizobiaceae bacterium]
MTTRRRIVITGSNGNLGRKLTADLSPDHDVICLDIARSTSDGPSHLVSADLSAWGDWSHHFDGADTVLHLAGEMRPTSSWAAVHGPNIVATQNVLRAAKLGGTRRVIFSSSNQVMAGYRFHDGPITEDIPPSPLNPYAVSKLIGEELGRGFHAETGSSFLAFRVGNIMPGENMPAPGMGLGLWGQQMWLSNHDMLRAFRCAIGAGDFGFAVLNLVSANAGMRWSMARAREVIGFVPETSYSPHASSQDEIVDATARQAALVPGYWLDQDFRQLAG